MDKTSRHSLPFLVPGQAQKEWFVNESLQAIDIIGFPVAEGVSSVTPPASPTIGQCFLVDTGASGAWTGHDQELAGWTENGWRFLTVPEGAQVAIRTSGEIAVRTASGWEVGTVRGASVEIGGVAVLGDQKSAISDPTGGTTNDAEARVAIISILGAMRAHGLIAT